MRQMVHFFVHGVQRVHIEQAPAQAGLIGGHHHMPAGLRQHGDGVQAARQRNPFHAVFDEIIAIVVDDAVAVEDDEFHAFHPEKPPGHFTARRCQRAGRKGAKSGLFRQQGNIRHPFEQARQLRQQGRGSGARPGRRPSPSRRQRRPPGFQRRQAGQRAGQVASGTGGVHPARTLVMAWPAPVWRLRASRAG